MSGVEKSAIYRIEPDNMVETIWSSKEENVFDLTVNGGDITFSTDQQGRIYRLTPELKSVLLVETREGEIDDLPLGEPHTLAEARIAADRARIRAAHGDDPGHLGGRRLDFSGLRPWGVGRL